MYKLLLAVVATSTITFNTFAEEPKDNTEQQKVVNVDKYYEAIKADRMNECIYENKIYSVGMIIDIGERSFVCNKFKVGFSSNNHVSSESPASWRVKTPNN